MDQLKIGRFIAARRKQAHLTQLQLAQQLNITDRAVSKWETGKSLPDASLMPELCAALDITVNDLLSGEVVSMDNYNKELERHLLDMVRQKEQSDKRLLTMEILIGCLMLIPLFILVGIASFVTMEEWLRVVLILLGLFPLLAATPFMIKIEQSAGYYQCRKCGHRHVPSYAAVFFAMHSGRTRYMRCPECGKCSWQKKVIRKTDDPEKTVDK